MGPEFCIWPGQRILCEPCHPPVARLMICGGRVLPVRSAGAVGANPPQESLRPTYRRGKATLESSPGNRAHRRCKWRLLTAGNAETLRSNTERGGTRIIVALCAT